VTRDQCYKTFLVAINIHALFAIVFCPWNRMFVSNLGAYLVIKLP